MTITVRLPMMRAVIPLWIVVILGIVEGLTEFLPVSSTGHLILVGYALNFTDEQAKDFEIAIQLGAVLSVVVYFRARLWQLIVGFKHDRSSRRLTGALALAFLPAAVAGLSLHKWIEIYLFGPTTVAWALIAGGIVILIVEWSLVPRPVVGLNRIGLRQALWVGMAQCLSLFPGVSRSGATIIGGILVGMDRKTATEFSFLLALPTLMAATAYKIVKAHTILLQDPWSLPVGLIVAFLTGWAVVAGFLAFITTHTFKPFAYYRIVLGLAILVIRG